MNKELQQKSIDALIQTSNRKPWVKRYNKNEIFSYLNDKNYSVKGKDSKMSAMIEIVNVLKSVERELKGSSMLVVKTKQSITFTLPIDYLVGSNYSVTFNKN